MNKFNKKVLAGTTSAAMVAGVVAPITTFASTQFYDVPNGSWAEDAINYGVGQGYIHGMTDTHFGFGQEIKRQDAAVIIASAVFGDSSNVPEATPSFSDVSSSSYAAKFIAALEQFGIVGNGKGYFNPTDTITRAEFAQMMVQAFNLEDNGAEPPVFIDVIDGAWYDNAITVLSTQFGSDGYPDGTWRPGTELTREEAAQFIYRVHANLHAPAEAIAISSVTVTDVNKIEVKFNQSVNTQVATVKLVKGQANYNVTAEWNETGNTVVLTSATKLNPDTYKVVVTGLTDTALESEVTVAAEVATSLVVSTTQVEVSSSAAVYFSLYNQYGTFYSKADASDFTVVTNESIDDVSFGSVSESKVTDARGNLVAKFNITNSNSKLKSGDVFRVTAVYGGLTAQANVSFVEPSVVSSLTFGTVAPLDGQTKITVGDDDLVVPYTAKDQYGNDYKLTLSEGITFVSSDKDVVNPNTLTINSKGQLTFDAGEDNGTAIVTAILPTGTTSQFSVTVENPSEAASVVISAPSVLVADGEKVALDVVIRDQYGDVIPNEKVTGVTFSEGFAINKKTGKLEGYVEEDDDFEVEAYIDGDEVSSIEFTVEEKAFANAISSVNFDTLYEVGATGTISIGNVVVKDQYGRDFTPSSVKLEKKSSNNNFSLSGNTVTAVDSGEEVFTVEVDGDVSKNITLTAVASSSITSYELAQLGTLYNAPDEGYKVTPELIGKTSAGKNVVLASNRGVTYTVSNNAVAVTSGSSIVGAGKKVFTSTTDETVTVTARDGKGIVIATGSLVVSNKDPKLVYITALVDSLPTTADVGNIFYSMNQYGSEYAETGTWYFTPTTGSTTTSVTSGSLSSAGLTTGKDYSVKFVSTDGNVEANTVITVTNSIIK